MLEFCKIAWRNLGRNLRRTLVITGAVTLGVWGGLMTMAIYNAFVYQMVDNFIYSNLGHLQVHVKGYDKNPSLRLCMLDGERVIRQIKGAPHMAGFAPRIYGFALAQSARASNGVLIAGIDPELEPTVTRIRKFVKSGSYFSGPDEPEVLVGKPLAHKLKVEVGDKLSFFMQSFQGEEDVVESFRIKGIYSIGLTEMDRKIVFLPLKRAEKVMQMQGKLNEIAITVDDPRNLELLKAELKKRLPPEKPDLKTEVSSHELSGETFSLVKFTRPEPGLIIDSPEAMGESFKLHPASSLVNYRLTIPASAFAKRPEKRIELTLYGVDPVNENRVSGIFDRVQIPEGSWLKAAEIDKELEANDDWVILSEDVAAELGVEPGASVQIISRGTTLSLSVAGLLKQSPDQAGGPFAVMKREPMWRSLKGHSAASEIDVRLKQGADPAESVSGMLSGLGLEVQDWKELWPVLAEMIQIMDYTNVVLLLCIYIIIAFGIANTMIMSVFERVRELGILKAIGTGPRQLFALVILESVMLSLIGMAAGGMVSAATIIIWAGYGLDLSMFAEGLAAYGMPTVIYPVLTLENILTAVILAVVIAIISALYPAFRASRLLVVEALRRF